MDLENRPAGKVDPENRPAGKVDLENRPADKVEINPGLPPHRWTLDHSANEVVDTRSPEPNWLGWTMTQTKLLDLDNDPNQIVRPGQ